MSIRDLWPRRPAPSPALAATLADLDRLVKERPELANAGHTLEGLLRAAFGVVPEESVPTWDVEALQTAWREGIPSFRVALPHIEPNGLRGRALALCDVLNGENPMAGALREIIHRRRVDLLAWWSEALAARPEAIDRQAAGLGLDAALARSVLRLALLPALARFSEALNPLRTGEVWTRGECPHCGTPPTLAESRGLEQRRYSRCGLCAADWPAERLRCPCCGETDHRAIHYSFVEGEQDRYRLSRCDSCGEGLKVIATLVPLSAPGLLVAELATVHLDFVAG